TNKVIGPGSISGPWTTGAVHSLAADDTIQDVSLSLTYTSGATYGVRCFKTNTRVVVVGATEMGVQLCNSGDTLQDSIVDGVTGGHGYGIKLENAGTISGTLSIGSTVNVATALATVNLTDSTVREAGVCNFEQCNVSCSCSDGSINYGGVNFIDDTILH